MLLQIVAFKIHVILYKYVIEKVLALCYTQYTRYTHFFKKMSTRIILKNSVNIGTAETQNTVLWTVYLMPCAPFEGVAALHPLGAPNYFTDKEKKDEKKRRAVRAAHSRM